MKNLNQVHLNGLRAVEAVGRLGSLQAAATELSVSVGAISQQVIKTEAQLGHPVFDRTTKGMVPTDFGLPLLARLGEGFRKLSEAVALAQRRDSSILTISVAPVFAARWLVHRLESFSALFPDINLRIDATTRIVDPSTSDVDLCIRVGKGHWPGIRAELILEQEVFPVCSPALAARLDRPEDILRLPVVIDGHAMFDWSVWFDAAAVPRATVDVRHVFNEASLCLDAAIAGQGVMLAWQTLAAQAVTEGRLVAPFPIRAKTGFGHYFITPADRRESAKVKAFKAWMKAELEASLAALEPFYGVRPARLPE
jgi:DNA-binding transcriptional LysR family regulator